MPPENEDDCELLDVLCDTLAIDEYQQQKQLEIKRMNQIMDLRAKARLSKK
jgi:hypothetical protein